MSLQNQINEIIKAYTETNPPEGDAGDVQVFEAYTKSILARRSGQAEPERHYLIVVAVLCLHRLTDMSNSAISSLKKHALELMRKSPNGIMPYELIELRSATAQQVRKVLDELLATGKTECRGQHHRLKSNKTAKETT